MREARSTNGLLVGCSWPTTDPKANVLHLTHELLSVTLGVRRAGVTTAINEFEKRGLISAERGRITIYDRHGLEEAAAGLCGVVEAERARVARFSPVAKSDADVLSRM